ncbi:hypothetical protein [Limibacterium fermenti]
MKDFFYWLFERLFDEKVNNAACWTILALAALFIVFQLLRGLGYILITG